MASAAVAAAPSLAALTGPVGWAVGLAAAYIDGRFILPQLLGKGRGVARTPRELGIPVGSNDAGAPRITAWGRRVRVPTHILWQDKKVREGATGSVKGGTNIPYRRVYFDALLSLNDRKTQRLHQLVGNGKLLIYRSRNTVEIASNAMTVTVTPGVSIKIDMQSTQELDFKDRFSVGDYAYMLNFAVTGGDIAGPWRVSAVTPHGAAPSSITLTPARGQLRTAVVVTPSVWPPSTIQRADDAAYDDVGLGSGVWTVSQNPVLLNGVRVAGLSERQAALFPVGTQVRVIGMRTAGNPTELYPGTVFRVRFAYAIGGGTTPYIVDLVPVSGSAFPSGQAFLQALATDWHASLELIGDRFAGKYFPPGFNPDAYYHDGDRLQAADALLSAVKGAGQVPAYRGTACQGLDDFFSEDFGNQLPFAGEALVDPDEAMTWPEVFVQVCERGGVARRFVDVTGIDVTPFDGFYIRGAPPTTTAIQPLLVAKSVVTQDRDGQVAFFHTWRADVVQIENGAGFSHLGARLHGEQPSDEKLVFENDALEDLPTQVTVRHQDPDNTHAEGVQSFALRNPIGVDWRNEQDVDLATLVMARKDARNLAATLLKRAWINGTTVRAELMGHYADLLENDVITVTDDDGQPVTVRIVQRDEGANELIRIAGVREDLALPVSGSPVQPVGPTLPTIRPEYQPADLFIPAIPGVTDSESQVPGLYVVAGASLGPWGGALIQKSDDDGQTWVTVAAVAEKGRYGRLVDPMPAYGGASPAEDWNVPEGTDLLAQEVEWLSGAAPDTAADDVTTHPAERRQNLCAIQDTATGRWEIASFAEAQATGPNVYTLEKWRRGINGTWPDAIVGPKPSGGMVLLLDSATFLPFSGNWQPKRLMIRTVVPGQDPESSIPTSLHVSGWANAIPKPVRRLAKQIGIAPFDARFIVDLPGTRTTEEIGSDSESMFEPNEEYRFDIFTPDGLTICRRKTVTSRETGSPVLRDRWVDYPATEQLEDGYTPSAITTFVIDCRQIGQFGESASVKQTI